jgi:hypothetical protein
MIASEIADRDWTNNNLYFVVQDSYRLANLYGQELEHIFGAMVIHVQDFCLMIYHKLMIRFVSLCYYPYSLKNSTTTLLHFKMLPHLENSCMTIIGCTPTCK